MTIVFRDNVRRYFLDTEFIEDGDTIALLSIAVVGEDPAAPEFYAASAEADQGRARPWVREHVLPLLPPPGDPRWMARAAIRDALAAFLGVGAHHDPNDPKPELWGYYADYDWVVLCQLFGRMVDLPRGMPMFCMDLKQLSVMVGSPRPPMQAAGGQHNALEDARWNRELFAFLRARCGT